LVRNHIVVEHFKNDINYVYTAGRTPQNAKKHGKNGRVRKL
jgi:hypothetical protein